MGDCFTNHIGRIRLKHSSSLRAVAAIQSVRRDGLVARLKYLLAGGIRPSRDWLAEPAPYRQILEVFFRFSEAIMFARRWIKGLGICRWAATLAILAALALANASAAWAQDDLKEATAAAEAAPAAAAPAAEGAPASAGKPAEAAPPPAKSQLMFYYEALGMKYVIAFLAISFTFVALVVMNFLTMRRDAIVPAALVEGFEAQLNEKNYQGAYELAKNDESFLGHVLSAGLAKLSAGYPQAIEAMQEIGEEESMKLEQRLSYIALIGTIAPMVGLLGTVDGMVASFQVIANSTTQPKPSELAQGISMALITTLVGLWIAIPAIAFFGIFRNRMARMVLEVGVLSEGLMARFSNVGGGAKK
jgi:biopolymer transport protein ExbB